MSTAAALAPVPPPAPARRACRHCGAVLTAGREPVSDFCCAGCSYVFRLVQEHGLAGYYQLKDEVTAPADAAVFQPVTFARLSKRFRNFCLSLQAPP